MNQRLGFLCGAPRVSTRADAEAAGPRMRVLGIVKPFEAIGWEVKTFIIGDRVPRKWVTKGSEKAVSSGFLRTIAADLVRLYLGAINARKAWRELGGQVDWIYEHFAVFQSLGWIFKQHGVPWILEVEAPFFYEAKIDRKSIVLSRIARRLELQAYWDCDVIACISETLKEIIVRESGIPPEKVVLVPNGVDTTFFDPEQHKPQHLFKNFTLGFVGCLWPWQRLDLLLEVLSELQADGVDISLVVVGDGPMRTEWEVHSQQVGVANTKFIGQIPSADVPRYIAGFDLCYSGQVQLQIGEMYLSPLKLYEYMAMTKPVVASAFEDSRRLIRDGETGFLFEAGNKNDLKSTILRAYHSRTMLTEMGRRAREEIIARHSWTTRVCTLIAEVERILG